MAVPRNRRSKGKAGRVRSHHAKEPKNTCECGNCKAKRLPHRMCAACGHYDGRAVVQMQKA
jgi:large subunit ribosomal protein L32